MEFSGGSFMKGIQNGKIIGAVTHVFVNDPTRGYGVYIDWMIDN